MLPQTLTGSQELLARNRIFLCAYFATLSQIQMNSVFSPYRFTQGGHLWEMCIILHKAINSF